MAGTESIITPEGVLMLGSLLLGVGLTYLFARAVYNVYFHPLSSFPGPRLAAASELTKSYYGARGRMIPWVQALHQQYGEVVRIGPNELSFITDSAWKDIYMHRPQFPKHFNFTNPNETDALISADDASHSRQRRLLAHAFSDKAIREQEALLHVYVDLLVSKLQEESHARDGVVDLVDWYRYTTFDVIADLCFGESFHGLENKVEHAWVSSIYSSMKATHFLDIAAREQSFKYPQKKVTARLNRETDRPDFMSYILRYNDEKGVTRDEIDSNFETFTIAGSDTTATLMMGYTYHLLQNPKVLERLNAGVRTIFDSAQDIKLAALGKMPYLIAVLEESLRIHPPVPGGFGRRVLPEGATISGRWVPGGTAVNIPQKAANVSHHNFAEANFFIPERWLEVHDPIFDNDRKGVVQPFSAGPRNCLGKNLAIAEMRIILAKMIWHFDMELMNVDKDWTDQRLFVLPESKPLLVKLKPRVL
ncbi:toxin biosynthesis cytochrome p450 [Lasallia pustulata]|uniref:Toxin biosynthesis cytochrome p450 n=1 Tax=Lasallia pustulata TaxID=136370 RepID=A0A1W5CY61_9LECA|nr:toxin biosynthesis cytochrome p450 [Lasallia pustulata]